MTERERWNSRYLAKDRFKFDPCFALQSYQHLLPAQGNALELACGSGGNALFMAAHGLQTEAWDIADRALAFLDEEAQRRGLEITTRAIDIKPESLPAQSFDAICVSHYLDRSLCPAIVQALKPGGVLIYQTFTRDRVSDEGPNNPDYRLGRNELLQLFSELYVLAYREEGSVGNRQQGWRDQALLVAQRL